jgi:hypothetical protein
MEHSIGWEKFDSLALIGRRMMFDRIYLGQVFGDVTQVFATPTY